MCSIIRYGESFVPGLSSSNIRVGIVGLRRLSKNTKDKDKKTLLRYLRFKSKEVE